METLLHVENLVTRYRSRGQIVHAVNGIDFSIAAGEVLGIVGESGCGKSAVAKSILGLIREPVGYVESGKIVFARQDLRTLDKESLRKIRGHEIAMIFQDPMTSLNPVLTVGRQLTEVIETHLGIRGRAARERAIELMHLVSIANPRGRYYNYPFEFSGGMRQRIMIAMAVACNPKLLIADEPTTALDVTIQAQIVELVRAMQKKMGMSVIWITHDLGVVARLAQRIIVMYAGSIVEEAPVEELYSNPVHPYTRGLLGSLPKLNSDNTERLRVIPGRPPNQFLVHSGCSFAPRCAFKKEGCESQKPQIERIAPDHGVACWEHATVAASERNSFSHDR